MYPVRNESYRGKSFKGLEKNIQQEQGAGMLKKKKKAVKIEAVGFLYLSTKCFKAVCMQAETHLYVFVCSYIFWIHFVEICVFICTVRSTLFQVNKMHQHYSHHQ